MKRTGLCLLALFLLTSLFCSCVSTKTSSYTIFYDLGDRSSLFTEQPTKAKVGETVEIKTVILLDADLHVYIDGEEIAKSHYDSDYWGYSFIMPAHNITVTCRPYSKAEIWGSE